MQLGITVPIVAVLLTASSASAPAPRPPPERVDAFFQAIARDDLAAVDALLQATPGLARAHDPQGSSALVAAAFIFVPGEEFHAPPENRILHRIATAAPPSNLFEACLLGDLERARSFLRESPTAVTEWGPFGWQPIHAAAFSGNQAVIALLLEAGAGVNVVSRNTFKTTPLQTALLGKQVDAARFLVNKGADVRWRQFEGDTALHDAAAMGDAELVRSMLAHGADPRARDNDGETPLTMAAKRGHQEVVRILEAAGAKR